MPIKDSIYTNPDTLRLLYRNPFNPLKDLDEEGANKFATQQVFSQPVDIRPTDIIRPPCPAVGQYTAALLNGTRGAVQPLKVEKLRVKRDLLWDPISRIFKPVKAIEIVHDVDCVVYQTLDGAESVVSVHDFLIQNFEDETGRMIGEMMQEPDIVHGNVSLIEFGTYETEIAWIADAGKRSVVKITLEGKGGGRYASGTDPLRMTMRHNVKLPDFDLEDDF